MEPPGALVTQGGSETQGSLENTIQAFQSQVIFSSAKIGLPKGTTVNHISYLLPELLLLSCFKDVLLFDLSTLKVCRKMENAHESNVSCSVPIYEMSKILTCGFDGNLRVWDIIDESVSTSLLLTMRNDGWIMSCMRLSSPSHVACMINRKRAGTIVVWDFFLGTKVFSFNDVELSINQICWYLEPFFLLAKTLEGSLLEINLSVYSHRMTYNFLINEDTSCLCFYRPKDKALFGLFAPGGYLYLGSYKGEVVLAEYDTCEPVTVIGLESLISEIYLFSPEEKSRSELLYVRSKQRISIMTPDLRTLQVIRLFEGSSRITSLVGLRERRENLYLATVDGELFRGKVINLLTRYLHMVKSALEKRKYSKYMIKEVFQFLCRVV